MMKSYINGRFVIDWWFSINLQNFLIFEFESKRKEKFDCSKKQTFVHYISIIIDNCCSSSFEFEFECPAIVFVFVFCRWRKIVPNPIIIIMNNNQERYEVTLYIYDLSKGMARSLSTLFLGNFSISGYFLFNLKYRFLFLWKFVKGREIPAIWHTSIVVYDREYFFGGGGIESCIAVSFFFFSRLKWFFQIDNFLQTFFPGN